MICKCRFCGFIWTATDFMRCPFCNCGNIIGYPFGADKKPGRTLNFHWLETHGFSYIRQRLGID